MKLLVPLLSVSFGLPQNMFVPQPVNPVPVNAVHDSSTASSDGTPTFSTPNVIDPVLMSILMKDSTNSELLSLLMMNPQLFANMDPYSMLMLLDNGDSDLTDLLPFMVMNQPGNEQQPGQINPLMLMSLLEETCTFNENLETLTDTNGDLVSTEIKENLATGVNIFIDANFNGILDQGEEITAGAHAGLSVNQVETAVKYVDYDYQACKNKAKNSMLPYMLMNGGQSIDPGTMLMLQDGSLSDLLPLMMMGGQNGQTPQTNNPMMMMSLLGDDFKMEDFLPFMMLGNTQQNPQQPIQMNPLMMSQILGNSKKTKIECDETYAVQKVQMIDMPIPNQYSITHSATNTNIRLHFTSPHALVSLTDKGTAYQECLNEATEEGSEQSMMSKYMQMNMMQGGQMDPNMMMLMMQDSDNSDNSLMSKYMQLNMMQNGQIDPNMMMLMMQNSDNSDNSLMSKYMQLNMMQNGQMDPNMMMLMMNN